jgi:hypothetical protein
MIGAIATAGRVEGGSFNLGVAPLLLVAMLFLLWAGPGLLAFDHRVLTRMMPGPQVSPRARLRRRPSS